MIWRFARETALEALQGNHNLSIPNDGLRRILLFSLFSGKSETPKGSCEWDSVEALEARNDSLSSELSDLMQKLKTMEVGFNMKCVERTTRYSTFSH
jgi:hypothetical protein